MKKHLLLIDLDGTLLDDRSKISHMNKNVIEKLKKQGHKIVIATGRAHYRSHMFYEELDLRTLMVNRNASHIHGPYDKEFKPICEYMDEETVEKILTGDIRNYMDKMYLEHLNNVYIIKGDRTFYEDYPLCQLYDEKEQSLSHRTCFICITIDKNVYSKSIQFLNQFPMIKYEQYTMREDKVLFNVYPIKSDKANSFSYLSEFYHIPHERIIAFGDGVNDINMIKDAHIGVAMKNAIDEVKEHAKFITEESNHKSGVGSFLNQYFNLSI